MFGEIESIDVEFDRVSGENKGQAIVHFVRASDAQIAIQKMNGFVISDTPIIVTKVPYYMINGRNDDITDDTKRGLNSSINRVYLSSKLAGLNTESELPQKQDKTEIEVLEKKIKRDKYYAYDETRVLGLFNLIDDNKVKTSNKEYVADIVKDVKSKLTS